jgi:hypothetical protein
MVKYISQSVIKKWWVVTYECLEDEFMDICLE